MTLSGRILQRARLMKPGAFALVMATGIVSIGLARNGLPTLAWVLLGLNIPAYLWLLGICLLRLGVYPGEMAALFATPGHGASFLALVAATCVLATQCLLVAQWPVVAGILGVWGAMSWLVLVYLLFFTSITRQTTAPPDSTINGSWLLVVVATQSLAILIALFAGHAPPTQSKSLMFSSICLYLIGCAWYLIFITLIIYRMVVLYLEAREFTPPYWINMGALAITVLAGSQIILHAPTQAPFTELLPFIKGFSMFFWATATWWLPLLAALELWSLSRSSGKIGYRVNHWDIVFPVGMYGVSTAALSQALTASYLMVPGHWGVYAGAVLWLGVAAALACHLFHAKPS